MNIELVAWTANILFILSYIFVLLKIVDGTKRAYSVIILVALMLYAVYSSTEGYYPMLALNLVNIFFGTRTIYRLSFHPEKKYKYYPVLFHVVLISAGIILAITLKTSTVELLTWIGGGFFLSAYCLLSSGKISEKGIAFNAMYIIAAGLYIIWAIAIDNWPVIALEVFLILISLFAIFRTNRTRRVPN